MTNWKTIQIEPQYEVSDQGEVRNKFTGHVKSLRLDKDGYPRVTLYPSGKTYTIHRLVAIEFLPNEKELPQVNHINGDKEDNSVENLEWCTGSENCKHKNTMLARMWVGEMNPMSKLTRDTVREIKYGEFDGLSNKDIGDLFNISRESVRRIRNGSSWEHV